jgi:hypothetical protein
MINLASFATKTDLTRFVKATDLPGLLPPPIRLPPRLEDRLLSIEKEVLDPGGAFKRMEEALKDLQVQKGGSTVTMGGYTFKDQYATEAWTRLLSPGDNVKYFVDARMQLEALKTRVKTTHNVITEEADARKAGYASHDDATTTATFTVPYP